MWKNRCPKHRGKWWALDENNVPFYKEPLTPRQQKPSLVSSVCTICKDKFTASEKIIARYGHRCSLHRSKYWIVDKGGHPRHKKPYDREKGRLNAKVETCVDCGKQIWVRGVRCKTCSNKHRGLPARFCVDCGVRIRPHSSRCLACHNKDQNKGASSARTLFTVSEAWHKVRQQSLKRDGFSCLICGKRKTKSRSYKKRVDCHHILSFADFPKFRLVVNNIATLCATCHSQWHFNEEFRINNLLKVYNCHER